jgi:hypothetical protein
VGRRSRDDDAEVAGGRDVRVVRQVICVHGLAGTCRVVVVDRVTESLDCRGSRLYICSVKDIERCRGPCASQRARSRAACVIGLRP